MHCVDLGESFPTSICLQKSASIQPRTSPSKFGGKFNSIFICVLRHERCSPRLRERRPENGALPRHQGFSSHTCWLRLENAPFWRHRYHCHFREKRLVIAFLHEIGTTLEAAKCFAILILMENEISLADNCTFLAEREEVFSLRNGENF